MSECVARVWDFRISRLEFANLRKPDDSCYDFYSVCLWSDKFFCMSVKQIRLLHLLRISSGENNQKSKRSDPSKISLVKAVGALEILGSRALGFFIFVSQIFVQISFLIYLGLKQFRHSICVSQTMRVTTFIPYPRAATISHQKIDPIKGSIVKVLIVQFHCFFVVFCW